MFTPIIVTDKETGRKVRCSIVEAEFFKLGLCTFEYLWETRNDDITVQIMNGMYENDLKEDNE